MRLLFIARHFTYFRNYDAALRELAARGHQIHLAVEKEETLGGRAAVEALAADCAAITYGFVPERTVDAWSGVARRLRLGLDYLRYVEPVFDSAPLLRVRARDRTPRLFLGLADPPLVGGSRWRQVLRRSLHAIDAAVPPPDVVVDYLRRQNPDALLITPLVELGTQQIDYVRAARALGIPTVLSVWSWDHLSSKAYLRECPDRVLVWNGVQRREAVEMHNVPPERVVVTGAQCFDQWFDRVPSRTRDEFFAALGLPADRPLVLYVCSSLIKGSPSEPPFVLEWLQRLRGSADRRLATAAVLIRPHPSHAAAWAGVDLRGLGPVVVSGGNPIDSSSRADYFDALYHSAAVVGLNTSAFIEAAIVGREVLTILEPRFHGNQEGTGHFRYLRDIGGGVLRVSRDVDTHLAELSRVLTAAPAAAGHPHRAFIETFIRPHGLGHPATPVFVTAVEAAASMSVARRTEARSAAWTRALFGRVARLLSRVGGDSLVRSPRELEPARLARIAAGPAADRAAGDQVTSE